MSVAVLEPQPDPAATEMEQWATGLGKLTGGRYEVTRLIARGGMSVVLLGWDRVESRHVALKLLDPAEGASLESRERFRREARIARDLAHAHIVPCYGSVHQDQLTLTILRYIPGQSLAERLEAGQQLGIRAALGILIPIADALAHAHQRGVVHRDVKPANILLHQDDDWPFLTDFGVATLRTSEHSRSEVAKGFGTPAFMAPEQVLGRWDADARTDIYSLGLVAYQALAGRLPFVSETTVGLAVQRTAWDAPPLRKFAPEVPERLAAIIDKCLARDPRKRWRSMAQLRRALERCRARLTAGNARPSRFSRWLEQCFGRALSVAPRLTALL
ncbi:MAG: serine/threonine-protein kinase [Gemmatimonadales bacterium]